MSDPDNLWARLIANGKLERWKRAAPARKTTKRAATSASRSAERDVLKVLQDAAALMGVTLLRNNVGALQDKHGRWVTYGLGLGSSDYIGWTSVTVTQEMVGEKIAVFTAVEGKREHGGVVSDKQERFIEKVLEAGGRAGVARNVEDLKTIVKK